MLGWKDVLVQYEHNREMMIAAEQERLVQSALCCKKGQSFVNVILAPFILLARLF